VDQADPSPIPESASLQRISRPEPSLRLCRVGLWPSSPSRNGESPLAVPEGGVSEGPLADARRARLIAGLRERIAGLERHTSPQSPFGPHPPFGSCCEPAHGADPEAWTLGAPQIDRDLAGGLHAAALHEVKGEGCGTAAADWMAALGFALRLTLRRLHALAPRSGAAPAQILWCWPSVLARELGRPYGHGLTGLGLASSACLFVETQRAGDALWAMEEGLRSQSLALVIGVVPEVALTPARRLSLAAAGAATPCLLITDPLSASAAATATRWRVGARASATHVFEAGAPGARRYAVVLERCREGARTRKASPLLLEWSDETHCFRVASRLADRAPAPRRAGLGSG
jgi:protein ImuA